MRSLLSGTALMLLATATAFCQPDQIVNPLEPLGVTFGAAAPEVIKACERAGLTVTKVDTSLPNGRFRLFASGWSYRGHDATLLFGGGGFGPDREPTKGLSNVTATIGTSGTDDARTLYSNVVDALTLAYGPGNHGTLVPPARQSAGFEQGHVWSMANEQLVEVMGSVLEPIGGSYRIQVFYCKIIS